MPGIRRNVGNGGSNRKTPSSPRGIGGPPACVGRPASPTRIDESATWPRAPLQSFEVSARSAGRRPALPPSAWPLPPVAPPERRGEAGCPVAAVASTAASAARFVPPVFSSSFSGARASSFRPSGEATCPHRIWLKGVGAGKGDSLNLALSGFLGESPIVGRLRNAQVTLRKKRTETVKHFIQGFFSLLNALFVLIFFFISSRRYGRIRRLDQFCGIF